MSIVCETTSELISEISLNSSKLDDIIVQDSNIRNKLLQIMKTKSYSSDYHIFVSNVANTITKMDRQLVDLEILKATLDALLLGLAAIESETISLSGSSIIKLLQWDQTDQVSRILSDNADFVAILIADLCAMFSKIEESGSAPFIRIVRFCELLIDVSKFESGLSQKLISSLHSEFTTRILRTTLTSAQNYKSILNWCNELLKACHRGNEFVIPILNEVFSKLKLDFIIENEDFVEILCNERSRRIENLVRLIFNTDQEHSDYDEITFRFSNGTNFEVSNEVYRERLVKFLDSFEHFKIPENINITRPKLEFMNILDSNRQVLFNWYPYCSKTLNINRDKLMDVELRMIHDVSQKVSEYLNL